MKACVLSMLMIHGCTIVSGFILSLKGSSLHTVWNMEFVFTCKIDFAAHFVDKVCFHRHSPPARWCVYQHYKLCSTDYHFGYEVICENDTSVDQKRTKTYTLKILRTSYSDSTQWWCQLSYSGARSNIFRLIVYGVIVSLTSTPTFIDNEHLMFTCTVKNSVNLIDLVCFQRHAPSFNWCINQNLNGCYPVRSRDFYEMSSRYTTHCGEGTNSTESHVKIYSLSIEMPSDGDAQQWWCELRFRGARSSFVKLNDTGMSVTLTGSDTVAVRGQEFTFTCTVKNDADFHIDVCFTDEISYRMKCIFQEGDKCTHKNNTETYELVCGPGTSSNMSDTRIYMMKLKAPTAMHSLHFQCIVNSRRVSNEIILDVHNNLLLLTGSSPYAVLGKEFVLTCTVENAKSINDRVCFFKQDKGMWCLRQHVNKCEAPAYPAPDYVPNCGGGTEREDADTKTYLLNISHVSDNSTSNNPDTTDWWCAVISSGEQSRILTVTLAESDQGPDSERFIVTTTVTVGVVVSIMIAIGSVATYVIYRRYKKRITTRSKSELTDLQKEQDRAISNLTLNEIPANQEE